MFVGNINENTLFGCVLPQPKFTRVFAEIGHPRKCPSRKALSRSGCPVEEPGVLKFLLTALKYGMGTLT